jgi:hypothetical protein
LLTGCTEPGEEIINVSKKTTTTSFSADFSDYSTSQATEDITIRVGDVTWDKKEGAWQGKPIGTRNSRVIYTPRDAKAMRAIDRYMKGKPY